MEKVQRTSTNEGLHHSFKIHDGQQTYFVPLLNLDDREFCGDKELFTFEAETLAILERRLAQKESYLIHQRSH